MDAKTRLMNYRYDHLYDNNDGLLTQAIATEIEPINTTPQEINFENPLEAPTTPQENTPTFTWDDVLAGIDETIPSVKTVATETSQTGTKAQTTSHRPRGYRNNNPLNIRISNNNWEGKVANNTDGSFEQFESMPYGYRAAIKNINTQINRGNNTLRKLIGSWAPASDGNSPDSYAQFVAKHAGIGVDDRIDPNNRDLMIKIIAAMAFKENGEEANLDDINAGYNLLG